MCDYKNKKTNVLVSLIKYKKGKLYYLSRNEKLYFKNLKEIGSLEEDLKAINSELKTRGI